MKSEETERIIDKIKKLIRHEQSARECSTPEEAAAFAVRIQELLIKHKISMSEIDMGEQDAGADLGEERVATGRAFRYGRGSRVLMEDSRLMCAVAMAHFCEAIILRDSNVIFVIGAESDRAVAVAMFRFLSSTMKRQARQAKDIAHRMRKSTRRFNFYFCLGFTSSVTRRYLQTRKDNDCMALIRSDQLVKAYVERGYQPQAVKPRKRNGRINKSGYFAGVIAGSQVNLGANVLKGE